MENNRVNVALSRAKKGMFCFGNFSLYAKKSVLWNSIVSKLESGNMIGPKIPLQCNQHLKETFVENSEEILQLVSRGCREKCEFQLPCGHFCVRKCHYDDMDHSLYQCPLPCEKIIGENKKCTRLCFQRCKNVKKKNITLPCGHRARQKKDGSVITKCEEEIPIHLPCNHLHTLPCCTDILTFKCKGLVSVLLPCGHRKQVYCHKKNDLSNIKCYEMKPVLGPCGHTIDVPCNLNLEDEELLPFCKNACGVLLKCGHPCTGNCFTCSEHGIHDYCSVKCDTILSCGHKCRWYCASPCPPCKGKCIMSCSHGSTCINSCNRSCTQCLKDCVRGCPHVGRCKNKCFENCSVDVCTKICNEFLPCGHKCIGLCGDPCPYLCRICNKEVLKSGNPEKDFYIQLEDCDHVIEIGVFDEHINNCLDCSIWPDCPLCSKPISKNVRYKDTLLKAKRLVLDAFDNSDEIDEVHYLLNSLWSLNSTIPPEFVAIDKKMNDILCDLSPSSSTLLVLKHCIMSLRNLKLINEKLKEMEFSKDNRLQSRFDTLLLWISNHLRFASYQQMDELEIQVEELKNRLIQH